MGFKYTVNRHRVIPESIMPRNCVPMVVHCRESAGTGPVNLKVVPVADAAFSGVSIDQILCAPFSPNPLLLLVKVSETTINMIYY